MNELRAFAPQYSPSTGTAQGSLLGSTTVAATNASATASTKFAGNDGGGQYQLQIANKSSAWAHVNLGNLGTAVVTAATVASYPVAPGGVVVITVDREVNGASVILDAAPTGTGNVIFTRGVGL